MAFTVGSDGHVIDPVVKGSSGNADLDEASSRCVARWTYRPAEKNGVAIAAPWKAFVEWKQRYHLAVTAAPHCSLPPQAHSQSPGTQTVISFVVTTEGAVSNIGVRQSSGDDVLDLAVSECVALWRVEPYRTKDGKAVEYPTSQTVIWTPPD
jgi:TonB family protein